MTAGGIGAVGSRWLGSHSPVHSRLATAGVAAVLDEVADAIAAIQEPPALAVDEAEAGLAGDDAFEAG